MKRITKILIFSFLLVVLFSTSAFASDVDGYKHEDDVRLIMGMGIMNGYEDGSFRPNDQITRAEFATVLMRTLGWTNENGAQSVFWDMNGHWAEGYVNKAYELQIANGVGGRAFAPNDLVTCQQAVKFINNALGYQEIVNQKGGYPEGDLSVGIENGLLKGVSSGYEKPITRGEAAKMVSNALEAKTVEVTSFSKNTYTIEKGDTLLSCLGYTVRKMNVTAAWGGSIDGTTPDDKYHVSIDGKQYRTTFTDGISYLGMTVDAYIYDENGDDETIRYMQPSGLTKVVSVYSDDIEYADPDTEIKYSKGSRRETLKLSNIVAVKNGVRLSTSEVTEELFMDSNSKITFIDSDGASGFETALIWTMDEYIVNRTDSDKIYCEFQRSVDLYDEDGKLEITIIRGGRSISINDIKPEDVISVSKSDDNQKIRVEVTSEKTYGEIVSISTEYDGDKTKVLFEITFEGAEESLYLSHSYRKEYDDNRGYFTKPLVGDKGTFYLNEKGEIVYMAIGVIPESEETDMSYLDRNVYKYGFLNVVGKTGWKSSFELELLTQDNEFVIFDVTNKIKFGAYVDGRYSVKKRDTSDIYDILSTVPQQIVKYRVDKEGKLTELCLSENSTYSSVWGKSEENHTRQFANFQLEQQYVIDSTTICFYIPLKAEDDTWKVSKAVTMLKSGSSYKTELLDVVDGTVGVVLYRPTLSTTRYKYVLDYVNSPVMLIEDVYTKVDETTDEYKMTIAGWVNGAYREVMVADTLESNSDAINKLKPGMLVQYLLNTEKRGFARYKDDPEEIILFNSICNFNNLGADFINWDYASLTDVNARIKVYKGTVNYVDNDTFYVSIDENTYVAAMHGGTTVMKMSRDGSGKFTKASLDDVTVGSVVVVRQRYNNTREVFIVE